MLVEVIFQAAKSLLFFFVGVWRRALCCFRRRRRMSCDSVPLTAIGVVSDYPGPSCSTNSNELENWNWEDSNPNSYKPNSIQEHIEYYRQQKQKIAVQNPVDENEEVIQQDFFEDMTPRITRQTKVLINDEEENFKMNSTRLSLAPQPIIPSEGELGEWEENSGWEEQTNPDWDPQTVLREKRRQERERRIWEQQQKRQEKVMRPLLGAKIS